MNPVIRMQVDFVKKALAKMSKEDRREAFNQILLVFCRTCGGETNNEGKCPTCKVYPIG